MERIWNVFVRLDVFFRALSAYFLASPFSPPAASCMFIPIIHILYSLWYRERTEPRQSLSANEKKEIDRNENKTKSNSVCNCEFINMDESWFICIASQIHQKHDNQCTGNSNQRPNDMKNAKKRNEKKMQTHICWLEKRRACVTISVTLKLVEWKS